MPRISLRLGICTRTCEPTGEPAYTCGYIDSEGESDEVAFIIPHFMRRLYDYLCMMRMRYANGANPIGMKDPAVWEDLGIMLVGGLCTE